MAPIAASLAALLLLPCSAANPDAPRRRLQAGVTLGGSVYYDVNGNSNREANEPGVPNATVQIRTCANERMGSARTNSIGEFSYALDAPGCYYARLDTNSFAFAPNGDVDPLTGRTEPATLAEGEARFFSVGVIPPEGSGIVAAPTRSPSDTAEPTTAEPTQEPTPNPTTGRPTSSPTVPATVSLAPTPCMITDRFEENLMGSGPIMRASFGMLFGLSTPSPEEAAGSSGVTIPAADETVRITSLSMRVLSPLMSKASSTNYKVYYRPGDYSVRGDLDGWTLVAEGNSLGEDKPDEETRRLRGDNGRGLQYEKTHEPLIPDEEFASSAVPSDIDDYGSRPSVLLGDGGMETVNYNTQAVKTYLYQIPKSVFTPVELPKFGGKASFYVTLDRALMQFGDADGAPFDSVDVENGEYDALDENDMNVRIHVGEGVSSFPWSTMDAFYLPRRFLGKVWYDQVRTTPCHLHETAPSGAPSILAIPPVPKDGVGENVGTTFVTSVFLQQPIRETRKMDAEVQSAFQEVMMDFLNEEWTYEHCVWGTDLDVAFQKLSLLQGVNARRRRLRGEPTLSGGLGHSLFGELSSKRHLQSSDITILEVEMQIGGKAYYDDPRVCPEGAIPARATTAGRNWDETMSSIGVDFISENTERLGNRLRAAHPYFDALFAVAADPDLIDRTEDDPDAVAKGEEESGGVPLIPIVAAAAGAAVVLLIVCFYCYYRKWQRGEAGRPSKEELGVVGSGNSKETADVAQDESDQVKEGKEPPVEQAPTDNAEVDTLSLEDEETDYLGRCWPSIQEVPELEDIIMSRGLPRRRSETCMRTVLPDPPMLKRSRSIGCLREIWINLNKEMIADMNGSYFDAMVNGTLYPIDDPDLLYFEREAAIMGEDLSTPYVQHGADIMDSYIDESDMDRIVHPPAPKPEKRGSQGSAPEIKAPVKVNPLVMQQVEMLEAKWKQLREEYDDENSDEDEAQDAFDVNDRIEQLMGRIEKLELERKMRLAELKRQEEEEEELARKRMVRAGEGINYEQEFKKEFVIRKKKKKKAAEEDDEMSEESESSSEEEASDGEYDVKWMRLKVPLAAQNPEAMRKMVEKGENM